MRNSPTLRFAVPLAAAAIAACSASVPPPPAGPGELEPASAVERFLHLASLPDYLEMGWIFGTRDGPILRRDPAPQVERRMYAIAHLLAHDHFAIRSQAPVPGRVGGAMQLEVALTRHGHEYLVPFTVVRGPGQRWFVEQVMLEAITDRP
jgi:hypothetical protein